MTKQASTNHNGAQVTGENRAACIFWHCRSESIKLIEPFMLSFIMNHFNVFFVYILYYLNYLKFVITDLSTHISKIENLVHRLTQEVDKKIIMSKIIMILPDNLKCVLCGSLELCQVQRIRYST